MYAAPAVVERHPAATDSKQGTSTTAGSRRSGGSSLCESLSLSATPLPFTDTRFPSPHPSPSLIPPSSPCLHTSAPDIQSSLIKLKKEKVAGQRVFFLLLTGQTDRQAAQHACALCLLCSDVMYLVGPSVNQ